MKRKIACVIRGTVGRRLKFKCYQGLTLQRHNKQEKFISYISQLAIFFIRVKYVRVCFVLILSVPLICHSY